MSQQYQSVGIIEIDADPTIGFLVARGVSVKRCENCGVRLPLTTTWRPTPVGTPATTPCQTRSVVLKANLRQLHWELENELTKFIDRLLARG